MILTITPNNENIQKFNADFLEHLISFGEWSPAAHLSANGLFLKYNTNTNRFHLKFDHQYNKVLQLSISQYYSFIENSSSICHITLPLSSKNELLFLLCEANQMIEDNPESMFILLFGNLLIRVCKIFGGAEPIPLDEQKGIVGEIVTITMLTKRFNEESLSNWSRSGLVDVEIHHLGYDMEVKTISDISNPVVNVSFANQLQYKDSIISLLFVVECKSTKIDLSLPTLPEFIDQMITNDYGGSETELGSKFIQCLEKEIEGYPWNETEKRRFTSRFDYSNLFSVYKISEGDSADQMAIGNTLPNGVALSKYKLDANVLDAFEDVDEWLG